MSWNIDRPQEYLVGFSSWQEKILEWNRRVRWTLYNIDADPLLYGDDNCCFVIHLKKRVVHVIAADGSYYYTMPITWFAAETKTLMITARQRQELYDAEPSGQHYFDRNITPGTIEETFRVTMRLTLATVEMDAARQTQAALEGTQPDRTTLDHLLELTAHHPRTHAMVKCYRRN